MLSSQQGWMQISHCRVRLNSVPCELVQRFTARLNAKWHPRPSEKNRRNSDWTIQDVNISASAGNAAVSDRSESARGFVVSHVVGLACAHVCDDSVF